MSFNDSKWTRVVLSRSNKTINFIKKRRITNKHHYDIYCFNYIHSFAPENKREHHKKLCEDKDFF